MLPSSSSAAQYQTVPLAHINLLNDDFRITTCEDVDDLLASIQHAGLISPPLLIKQTSGYKIVSGFRRVAACRKLGWKEIIARILEPELNHLACLRLAIADNALQRPLNLVEKSRSYAMLSEFYPDDSSLAAAAPSLGLNDNPSFIKKIIKLCRYPETIQNGILSGTISLPVALDLGELEPETGAAFAKLFSDFKLSLNKQRETITLIKEIAIREAVSALDILNENGFKEILDNEDLDRTQKIRDVRSHLKRRRFPALASAEETFQVRLKKLKLGKGLKLIPPANFEGSDYIFSLYFKNLEELKNRRATLDKVMRDPKLTSLLD